VGSAADLLEVFGIVSGDEHCGAKDVLDVLDVVAHVVVEEGWDSCGGQVTQGDRDAEGGRVEVLDTEGGI